MKDILLYSGMAVALVSGATIGRRWRITAADLLARMKTELRVAGFSFSMQSERFLLSRMLWQPHFLAAEASNSPAKEIVQKFIEERGSRIKKFKWAFAGAVVVACLLMFANVFV